MGSRAVLAMSAIARLDAATLEALCKMLADASDGLTGSEIGTLLCECSLEDPAAGITKPRRLLQGLDVQQKEDGHVSQVLAFVQAAMHPARYVVRHRCGRSAH